jgi:putative methanogenesis marker protein 2
MDLESIAKEIRGFEGVLRKRGIGSVAREMGLAGAPNDDAAIVQLGEKTLLFACDSIFESLIEADPYFAGYSAVLVNVNDIAAMGGKPIALVDSLSAKDEIVASEIARGVGSASQKFGVPIVGGHFNPNASCNAIEVAILGEAETGKIIKGSTAEAGDVILAVIDMDGELQSNYDLAWDSTTNKSSETVQKNLGILRVLAKEGLVKSCRDISNPGLLGTLGMILEASDAGGTVEIEKIPIPNGVETSHWLKTYPGFGFVFTADESTSNEVVKIFARHKISASVIGSANDTKKLLISREGKEEVVFNFNRQSITGVS